MNYFNGINLRFSSNTFTTNWLQLEKGIVTGCTISVIPFVMDMNMIIKAAERESTGPKTNTEIRLPSSRGFMDDMTVTTETDIQARWVLAALDEMATWARMRFKPGKSRSLVVRKGKVTIKFKLCIQGEEIPSLEDKPIKCLGKWFDSSLKDTHYPNMLRQQVAEVLQRIEKSELPGKFKAWVFQHGLLPRVMWPLMVNDVRISTVEKLEQMISKHLRKWLGLPPSFTNIGLYGRSTKLQMPISSLVEEFKVAKARLMLTLRDSEDEKVGNAGIQVRTERKWSVSKAVDSAESSLKHKDVVGSTNVGREGLGTKQTQRWGKAGKRERRDLVQKEIRNQEEQARSARAVQFGPQGDWPKWSTPERKLTWQELWTYEPLQLSFLLRAAYDMLPTPQYLQRWKLTEDPTCPLCGSIGTLRYILSSCPTALAQGRYRWRHDQVLRMLADALERERKKERPRKKSGPQFISFVKEGTTKLIATTSSRSCILQDANDWEMRADLVKKLVFPEEVAHTTLRPDIVLWSKTAKRVILVELTVPWEERIDVAYELMKAKYQDLADVCRERGWKTWIFPVEIGCRGFPSQSVWKMFGALGAEGRVRKTTIHALDKTDERSSSWLWLRRSEPNWKPS
ncbi:uncharacterized protein LOC127839765 [Dreissena polymorpha]|uniref:uncharacterized protein LOC127839765 n=1 Tax=Dreissena polymorpha TaxID=45954 RepID=UPI0022652260|nr:uncharacterized protein LOC127839765 [Dreissena polymorpha]